MSAITLVMNTIIAAIAVVFKMLFLIPLLIRWNFPLSEIPGPKYVGWSILHPQIRAGKSLKREGGTDDINERFGMATKFLFGWDVN